MSARINLRVIGSKIDPKHLTMSISKCLSNSKIFKYHQNLYNFLNTAQFTFKNFVCFFVVDTNDWFCEWWNFFAASILIGSFLDSILRQLSQLRTNQNSRRKICKSFKLSLFFNSSTKTTFWISFNILILSSLLQSTSSIQYCFVIVVYLDLCRTQLL